MEKCTRYTSCYVARIASLKTSCEKLHKNSLREKEYNSLNYKVKHSIIGIKISAMSLWRFSPWTLHLPKSHHADPSDTSLERRRWQWFSEQISEIFTRLSMQDFHFVHLLQLMCIEELGVYMLCEIALHVTRLDLCNTSGIIFIDNCWGLYGVQSTWHLDVADYSSKPYTFSWCFI